MSHLAHIVALKQALIAEGVTNPVKQIEVVRTCYVKALISIEAINKLPEQQCFDFFRFVLGYWNEVTPVDGHAVVGTIANFCRAMDEALKGCITDDKLNVTISEKPEGVSFDYTKLSQYADVINTLRTEATFKLSEFLGKEQLL